MTAPPATDEQALRQALQQLLQPLARLAVAQGLPSAQVEVLLQEAFVQAALEAHGGTDPSRRVSRVSTVTGLNRRLVTRLVQSSAGRTQPRRAPAAEVFTRWTTDPAYQTNHDGPKGQPRVLPRQGDAPSFEALAQSVTKDLPPRSLLAELVRLGLARHHLADDTVQLLAQAFVPQDRARLLGVLGNNVGDHLSAAVDNVRSGGGQHLERAVFADGLSATSAAALRLSLEDHWQRLLAELVPQLQAAVAQDEKHPATATHRVRVGLFSYDEGPPPPAAGAGDKGSA